MALSLDGESVYIEMKVREPDGKQADKRIGPFFREMAEMMLGSAKQQPWFVDGKIVEAKRV